MSEMYVGLPRPLCQDGEPRRIVSPDRALGDEMGLPRKWLQSRFDEFDLAPRPILHDTTGDVPGGGRAAERAAAEVLLDHDDDPREQPKRRTRRKWRGLSRLLDFSDT